MKNKACNTLYYPPNLKYINGDKYTKLYPKGTIVQRRFVVSHKTLIKRELKTIRDYIIIGKHISAAKGFVFILKRVDGLGRVLHVSEYQMKELYTVRVNSIKFIEEIK